MFDPVADCYDRARPSYPNAIYDTLESEVGTLRGTAVVDVGAGTGIATRQLRARGARVVSIDMAEEMLRRANARSEPTAWVIGDGHRLPLRSGSVRLACFAQAWHWFDPSRAGAEVARVVGKGGFWAAWWSHARADGEPWFDRYQDVVEAPGPGCSRRQRDTGYHAWSDEPLAATGLFDQERLVVARWVRQLGCERWLTERRARPLWMLSARSKPRTAPCRRGHHHRDTVRRRCDVGPTRRTCGSPRLVDIESLGSSFCAAVRSSACVDGLNARRSTG
jgi:SAM-dependent methyltransferase